MNIIACLKAFITVVNYKSYTVAARKLYVSASKLSKQVAWLEHEFKTQLLRRSRSQFQLTAAGKMLYERAAHLIAEINEIKTFMIPNQVEPQGCIRLYITLTMIANYVNGIVNRFMQLYPQAQFKLVVGHDALLNLTNETFDLAIGLDKVVHPGFTSEKFLTIKRGIYGAPSYFKRSSQPKSVEDLVNHNFLLNTNPLGQNWWIFDNKSVYLSGNFQSNEFELLKRSAIEGIGLILAPLIAVTKEVKEKTLKRTLPKVELSSVDLFLTYLEPAPTSAIAKLFVEFFAQNIKADGLAA